MKLTREQFEVVVSVFKEPLIRWEYSEGDSVNAREIGTAFAERLADKVQVLLGGECCDEERWEQ